MAAASTAAAGYVIANALKASGAIVRVSPTDFGRILDQAEEPLIVCAPGGVLRKHYRYLTGHKGLVFFTKTESPLEFRSGTEVVWAKKIWIPD